MQTRNSASLRTAEVARRTGYSVQQVRNLERDGALPPATRTATGYRVYGDVHVRSACAYRALAAGTDPASAKTILRAVHNGDRRRVFAMLDTAHARLDRERRDLDAARTAAQAIADEPNTDIRPTDAMSISELARALGVRPSTLRHWDAAGLVVPRRSGVRETRVFTPDDVRAARLVHQLRLAGYGIESLRQLVPELGGRRHWNDLAAALTARDARIDARSAALLEGAAALSALLELPERR
ncbi:MerR family transcriptional regulator [Nocardia speluncae]|uniref:MerR family transcriptional regulator n=1 Tax=Nocardia speluncae TaxID=419477 RepID=A0A846XA29_9NOCA|nr:MerR family transcriptional regulator [Nocardia speluncae]NKY32858.1 MerR family transcriptional regulator [Nocardia speluncae]